MSSFNRYPPTRPQLDKAHTALMTAFSHLMAAAARMNPDLMESVRPWAPESVAGLGEVHKAIESQARRLANTTADLAYQIGKYQHHWEQYFDAISAVPQRHPVTRDRAIMAQLLRTALAMDSPAHVVAHLESLGLSPEGPDYVDWTVVITPHALVWEPVIPAADPVIDHTAPPTPCDEADVCSDPGLRSLADMDQGSVKGEGSVADAA